MKVWMWIAFFIHIAILYDNAHVLTNPLHAPGVQFLMGFSPTIIAALIVAGSRARRAEAALPMDRALDKYRAMAAEETPVDREARMGRLRTWVRRLDGPNRTSQNWDRV